jgi:hypothetical protein
MALGGGPADQFDLAGVEAKSVIGCPALWFDGAVIGQEDALRTSVSPSLSPAP